MKKALLFFLLLIAYAFISIPLAKIFGSIQKDLFYSSTDVLFMHTKITNAIMPIGILICIGVFWIFYYNKAEIKKYLIIIALFIITLLVAFVDIFSYSAIGHKGITIRKSIVEQEKHYAWENISFASIDYSYGKNKYGEKYVIFEYYLTLSDGNKISLRRSEEFRTYDKVMEITEFLKSKGITINKAEINSEDLDLIVSNYQDEYGQNTEKMFRELYNVVN